MKLHAVIARLAVVSGSQPCMKNENSACSKPVRPLFDGALPFPISVLYCRATEGRAQFVRTSMAWMMKGEKLLPHNVHSPTRFKAPLVLSVAGPFHEQRGPFLE